MSKIWLPESMQGGGASPPSGDLKPWIAFNHLELIKDHLKEGTHFMEWGAGGSSIWFTENIDPSLGVKRVVIESDHEWADRVRAAGTEVLTPTERSYSRNDHSLDCSCPDPNYICRPEAAVADVILVDGWNRSHCIAWLSHVAKPGTVVFLHDAEFVQLQWLSYLPCWKDRDLIESDGSNNPSALGKFVLV
jgi:hypothetical protein